VIKCKIARTGSSLIESIERDGKQIAKDGQLVVMRQDQPSTDATPNVITEKFTGDIEKVTVEQSGPMRGVVKIEGKHKGPANRAWLPFVVRFYFYAGGDSARIMHTFIFDGDEKKDFNPWSWRAVHDAHARSVAGPSCAFRRRRQGAFR